MFSKNQLFCPACQSCQKALPSRTDIPVRPCNPGQCGRTGMSVLRMHLPIETETHAKDLRSFNLDRLLESRAMSLEFSDFLIRILAALAMGLAIGLDRQLVQHPAGVRPNALVCRGSPLFVSLSAAVK